MDLHARRCWAWRATRCIALSLTLFAGVQASADAIGLPLDMSSQDEAGTPAHGERTDSASIGQPATLADLLRSLKRIEAADVEDSADRAFVTEQLTAAGKSYRAMIDAGPAAGQPPHSCPPPRGDPKATLNSRELLTLIDALPEDQRSISVEEGLFRLMAIRYPC